MKQNWFRHIVLSVLLLVAITSFGQQEPMFTQYMNNPQLLNPAYAGSHGNINFNGIFRKQWVGTGLDWQPTTTSLSVSSPVYDYRFGLGLDFINDKIGPLQETSLFLDYAYQVNLSNNSTLALGVKTGFYMYQLDMTNLSTTEYDEYIVYEPLVQKLFFNAGVGAYYFTDKFFAGVSIPKLLRNSLTEDDNTYEILSKMERHLYVTTGYVFELNADFKLKPTFMFRTVGGSPGSYEFTATVIMKDKLWLGAMYRLGDAVAAHARIEIRDGFQIGYSYDLTTSELCQYNKGTHEIFFSYTIKKKEKRILSPRYF